MTKGLLEPVRAVRDWRRAHCSCKGLPMVPDMRVEARQRVRGPQTTRARFFTWPMFQVSAQVRTVTAPALPLWCWSEQYQHLRLLDGRHTVSPWVNDSPLHPPPSGNQSTETA